jgi:hypothetical protein
VQSICGADGPLHVHHSRRPDGADVEFGSIIGDAGSEVGSYVVQCIRDMGGLLHHSRQPGGAGGAYWSISGDAGGGVIVQRI